jgi:hypothetical protein
MRFPCPAEYYRRSRTGYLVPRSLPGVYSFRCSPSRSSGVRLHRFTLTCSGSSSRGLQALFRDPRSKPPISHAAGEPTTWDPSSSHEVSHPSSVHDPMNRPSGASSSEPPQAPAAGFHTGRASLYGLSQTLEGLILIELGGLVPCH